MKFILPVLASLILFSSAAFADNCSEENVNNPVPCCTTGHCFRPDGCKITPCIGVGTSDAAFSKGAAPTSTFGTGGKDSKATNYNPNEKTSP